jgi:deoxyribodipyrimidine photolyase
MNVNNERASDVRWYETDLMRSLQQELDATEAQLYGAALKAGAEFPYKITLSDTKGVLASRQTSDSEDHETWNWMSHAKSGEIETDSLRLRIVAKDGQAFEQTFKLKKNFRVYRATKTVTDDSVVVSAVDKYEAETIARENADKLTWSEPTDDGGIEVDFSAEEVDGNGETETDRHVAQFRAMQASETK